MNVSGGGAAGFVKNSVGTLASSYGFITVDGESSTLTNSGNLYIGQKGYGELTVSNGAAATANDAYLGYADGANGYVTVTGAGSTLTVSSTLNVGSVDGGIGSLTVAEGGLVKVTGGNTIFLQSGSTLAIGVDNGAAGTIQAYAIHGITGSKLVLITVKSPIISPSQQLETGACSSSVQAPRPSATSTTTPARHLRQPTAGSLPCAISPGISDHLCTSWSCLIWRNPLRRLVKHPSRATLLS